MHPSFLTAIVVLGSVASVFGSPQQNAQNVISESSTTVTNSVALGDMDRSITSLSGPTYQIVKRDKDQVSSFGPSHDSDASSNIQANVLIEDSSPPHPPNVQPNVLVEDSSPPHQASVQAHILIDDSAPPRPPVSFLQFEATAVNNLHKDAVQKHHPTTVPQMQSTMAPVEAAQTFRSFQSAQASISAMSKVAATQKGPAAATLANSAASASASLAESRNEIEKNLIKSCKHNADCEKYYKDGMKSGGNKGKDKNIVWVPSSNESASIPTSIAVVAFTTVLVACLLM